MNGLLVIMWTIAASFAAAVLYRLGGTSAGTKWRDFGVPAVAGIYTRYALEIQMEWWGYALCMLFLFAHLTTYNKWVSKFFGFKDWKTDVYWPSWAFTGLTYALAWAPVSFTNGKWLGFTLRCVILTITTCVWSQMTDKVDLEEGGRGALIILTMPLLLI